MTRDDAILKIRKLLQRNGRTEAEVDTATILAAAIAEKHGIDIAQLDQVEHEQHAVVTHRSVGEWARIPPEAEYASFICKKFFEVSAITEIGWTQKMIFVGYEWHLQVAEYVFGFLVHEFRWLWNRRRGRCRRRRDFIYGAYVALSQKLEARFAKPEGSTALEISHKAKRDAYIKETMGEITSHVVGAAKNPGMAAHRGYIAGKDIEIRPGVSCTPKAASANIGCVERRLLPAY